MNNLAEKIMDWCAVAWMVLLMLLFTTMLGMIAYSAISGGMCR